MKDRIAVIYGLSDDQSNFPDPTAITVDALGNIGVRLFFASNATPVLNLADNSDVVTPSSTANKIATVTRLTAYDPTNNFYRRLSARATNALGTVAPNAAEFGLDGISFNMVFDGTNYQRLGMASAANLANQSGANVALVSGPGEWAINHAPVAGSVATISKNAVAGQRHVCKGLSVSVNAVANITVPLVATLRDGATGAGTILWQERFIALAGTRVGIDRNNLNIVGSVNTAMTLEFTAAPAGTDFETVNLNGYTAA